MKKSVAKSQISIAFLLNCPPLQTLKEMAAITNINKARKVFWFEKFFWFIRDGIQLCREKSTQ